MASLVARFIRDDRGQDLIEYALLAGFIAISVTAALMMLGGSLDGKFNETALAVGSVGG